MCPPRPTAALLLLLLARCSCPGEVVDPDPPRPCAQDIDCLPGERCGESGQCEVHSGCRADTECQPDERCRVADGTCRMRPGFGRECELDANCFPGFFCALGRCRDTAVASVCASFTDCPFGMRCDRLHFFCIEEVPCTLGADFAEVTCDPDQACDPATGACLLSGAPECAPDTQLQDCGPDELCDLSGRCVQCVLDADCGPGLRCNARAGRCESDDLCRNDADCTAPLICDPAVALCRVPLPPCASDLDCALYELCNRVTGTCEPLAGKCVDDRLEENDSPAGARSIAINAGAALVDELTLCPDDDDYFAVELAAGDALSVTMQDTEAAARAEIALVDGDGVRTLRRADAPPRGDGRVSLTVSSPGIVYLRSRALTAPTPYTLQLSVSTGTPCAADALEGVAGNNVVELAAPLQAGVHAGLTLCDRDVDHYLLELAAGEALQVRTVAEHADIDLTLLATADLSTLAQAASSDRQEQLYYRSVVDQLVVLRVAAFSGAPDSYQLELELVPPYTCEADLFEGELGNNLPERATLIDTAGLSDQPLALCLEDVDWLRFELEDFERLIARARFEPGAIDLDLEAYFDEGQTLVAASRVGAGLEALSVPAAGVARSVWLAVRAADGAQAPYALDASVEPALTCTVDPDEPNEIPAQAGPAPAAAQRTLCGFDQDVYRVDLAAGRRLDARIEFSPFEGDLDLQLIHPDGSTPLLTSDGVTGSEHIGHVATVDGVHYLRVYSLGTDAAARYLLGVEVSEAQ